MTIKEMIEVMTAFENGQEIEFKNGKSGSWMTTLNPQWDFLSIDYRVKPKTSKRLLTIKELWGKTLINPDKWMFTVSECRDQGIYLRRVIWTVRDLYNNNWKVAGPDLNYETATSLEIEVEPENDE